MKARHGYTLVEILAVIVIIGVVLTIGTILFDRYAKSFTTETEMRMIYSELLKARAAALYQRRGTRVKLYRDHFEVYSSLQDNGKGVAPIQTGALQYPVTCNLNKGDGLAGYPLDFDPKGVGSMCSICLESSEGAGALDSVVLSATRVSIGSKKNKDDTCNADNITKR